MPPATSIPPNNKVNSSTVPYGNYTSYYSKRRDALQRGDDRLASLPPDFFLGKRVLDLGCNSGFVSVEIAQTLKPAHVHGVDIDAKLIQQANTHLAYVHSLQSPLTSEEPPTPNHFPIAFPRVHGFIPLSTPSSPSFPHNVSYEAADWVVTSLPSDSEGYDLILAFSLSKWIHLNHLDAGLLTWFRKVYDSLKAGGRFVLEKQGWKGYREGATKGGLKENRKKLHLRPDDFGRILTEEIGFLRDGKPLLSGGDREDGTEEERGFSRLIEVFVKPSSPSKPGPLEAVEDQVSSEQMQEPSVKKEKRKKKRERERDGTEREKSKKATIS